MLYRKLSGAVYKVKIVNVSNNEYIMFQRRDLHDLYASSVRLTDYYNTNEVKTYPKIIVDCLSIVLLYQLKYNEINQ